MIPSAPAGGHEDCAWALVAGVRCIEENPPGARERVQAWGALEG